MPTRFPGTRTYAFQFTWILLFSLLTVACHARGVWRSEHFRDHPLVGEIWDVRAAQKRTFSEVVDRLSGVDYVLIGEVHTNPDHHRFQAKILEAIGKGKRKKAAVLEMIDASQQRSVDTAARNNATTFLKALGFDQRGWGAQLYRPVFSVLLADQWKILGANLSRDEIGNLIRSGEGIFPPSQLRQMGLTKPLAPFAHAALSKDIEAGHCGYSHPEMTKKLIEIQRLRDALFTEHLLNTGEDFAVLLAGNGHIRADYGVPFYLEMRRPNSVSGSIAILEVSAHEKGQSAYELRSESGEPLYDFVFFTPVFDPTDPCEKYRESLEKGFRKK